MDSMRRRSERPESDLEDTDMSSADAVRVPGQRSPDLTRRVILDAATAEFVEKGFAGASVNEIADRANVNKRMLYHYFGPKDKLYIAVLERSYTALRNAQSQLNLTHLPPKEAIETLIRFNWNYYIDHPDYVRLISFENLLNGQYANQSENMKKARTPLIDVLNDVIKRGQDEGVFRAEIKPIHLYLTIVSLTLFYIATHFTLANMFGYDSTAPGQMEERLDHIIKVVLDSLSPQ